MTVREWINFLSNDEKVIIGLKTQNGLSCKLSNYFPREKALKMYVDWLDEEATIYSVLIYK